MNNSEVVLVADRNPKCEARLKKAFPSIGFTSDENDILTSPKIDVVAVVTPVWTHYELAKARAGERQARLCREAVHLQRRAGRRTDRAGRAQESEDHGGPHLPVHRRGARRSSELVDDGTLGNLYYYDSLRVNLGLVSARRQRDLGPGAARSVDHGLPDCQSKPEAVVATGEKHLNGLEDVAFITVYFPNNIIAHINVNWLSPVKVRTTLIGGEKKMLVWNDLEADEKIKIYDKGVQHVDESRANLHHLLVSYRSGDMWAPQVEQIEALRAETGLLR